MPSLRRSVAARIAVVQRYGRSRGMGGLEVWDRVDRRAAEADLEVQVGAGGVAGAADVADDLARGHGLTDRHRHARLVTVQRAHAAAEVEHHRVAVAALPTRDHDLPGLAGADRGTHRRRDVDTR